MLVRTKKWLRAELFSALQTFLAGFLAALAEQLLLLDVSALDGITWSVVAAILLTCVRFGIRALNKRFVHKNNG